ncbi:hypothetical protein HCN51_56100 [Nonomuraea sp. FMUSA5-5]|uniref:Uncharacterized protein n=1 Tax=Nonomuraea composti TaxID=2720023 RepID=A0ABX1BLM8_9ACTN|nr:hypothetical protein [Nonomuraea sp. FMUSA5-5]NJP98648.1 hypothetical protein [Nonomuraea sp. FMUSA5-5]
MLVDTAKEGHRHRHFVKYLRPRGDLDPAQVIDQAPESSHRWDASAA